MYEIFLNNGHPFNIFKFKKKNNVVNQGSVYKPLCVDFIFERKENYRPTLVLISNLFFHYPK